MCVSWMFIIHVHYFLGNGCIEGKELEHFILELEVARKGTSVVSHTFLIMFKNIRAVSLDTL